MDFCKQTHNVCYFDSVKDIPKQIWDELGCADNLYFNPKYLLAIANNHENIEFYYMVLFDNTHLPIAFSTIQIVNFQIDSVQNDTLFSIDTIKCLFENLNIISNKKPFKILTCGNTFVSGEHGLFIKNNQNKQAVIKELGKCVVDFVNSNSSLNKEVKGYMLKDFDKESLVITDELHEENYYSFNVEPNMLLTMDADWHSFQDYLGAMKTKFRVKANKALERSAFLEIKEITKDTIDEHLGMMNKLYNNVLLKATFNLGKFNLESFKALKANLEDNYIVKVYFLNNQMVGFLSAMIHKNTLDAHFVGIDYELNREFAIYQRMLYDYVSIAIDKKLKTINFGRTASEIKSSLGAVPQDLTIYFKHKNSIPNKLLKLFLNKIQPTPFRQNFPFKAKKFVEKA